VGLRTCLDAFRKGTEFEPQFLGCGRRVPVKIPATLLRWHFMACATLRGCSRSLVTYSHAVYNWDTLSSTAVRRATSCIEPPHLETRLGLLLRLLAITTRQTTTSLPFHPSLPAVRLLVTFAFFKTRDTPATSICL